MLTELENREAGVDGAVQCQHRLQHVDGDHRLEDPEGVERRLRELLEDDLVFLHQLDISAFA